METYLITAVIVVLAMSAGAFLGYFSGFDAGRREVIRVYRSRERHPVSRNLRLVQVDDEDATA